MYTQTLHGLGKDYLLFHWHKVPITHRVFTEEIKLNHILFVFPLFMQFWRRKMQLIKQMINPHFKKRKCFRLNVVTFVAFRIV